MKPKSYILILSLATVLLITACGKKGEPLPKALPLPGGINDFSGEVKDGVLFLTFTIPSKNKDGSEIKDLEGFKIFKSCSSCMGTFELFRDVSLTGEKGFTIHNRKLYLYDDELVHGFQYAYKVYPYTKKGTRGDPSNLYLVKWEKPPEPPKAVSAKEDDETIQLKWAKEGDYLYNVYRHDDKVYPLFPLNSTLITSPEFLDKGLENGKKYVYDVRVVRMSGGLKWEGEGAKVEAVPHDRTPPSSPINIKAEKKEKGVCITWDRGKEKDLMGYNVYRIDTGKAQKLNETPIDDLVFVDKIVTDSRYVSYYVTALDNAQNESEPSREFVLILKE